MASRTRLLAPAVLAVLLTSAAASAQARTPRPACRAVGVTVPSGTGATLALPCRHAARIRIVGRPLHGILRRVAGGRGRFVYTPVAGFAGRDAVRFAGIARGRSSKPVTAAIKVMPPRVEPAPPPPSAADPVVAQAPVQVHVDPAPPPPPPPAAYENPVSSSADDPFVLKDGDDYWELSTGDRFPMLHSSDLVHWTGAGRALASRPSWVVQTGDWNPWSPSVVHTAAGYVMFYTGLDRDLVHCVA